jgi:predicted MFS family arabinose efflux permease
MSVRLREFGNTSDRGALPARYQEVSVEERHLQPLSVRSRTTLSGTMAYVLVTAVIGLALFASVTPSPLYREYASLWQLTSVSVTLVYATYAVGVLIALVLAGSISDRIGRKPVLIAALSLLAVSTLLYVIASSVVWLFAARALQGLATGTALGAASAAMLELHPRRDAAAVGITNAVTSASGIAVGILISSTLVQSGWEPRVLPYIVLLILLLMALLGAIFMPEPVKIRQRFKVSPQRPTVPSSVRGPFLLASLAVLSSWSIGGLYFSLGPSLSSGLFQSSNVIVSGIGIVALAGSAAIAGLVFGRAAPWINACVGSVALAVGMIVIVVAAASASGPLYLVGSVIGGFGFGLAFLGGVRGLVTAIPPKDRAAVMSAFYVVAYVSLSLPAVAAGVVVSHLKIESTFEIFGGIVAALAFVVASLAWHTRPASRPQ